MPQVSAAASKTIQEIFDRVASDLSMLSDCDIDVGDVAYEERQDRPAGCDSIHISYRFGVDSGTEIHHGTMLIPLSESIALAAYLMMAPKSQVEELQAKGAVEGPVKEAMLEVGTFVAGASDAAMRAVGALATRVVFEGCQGVRADVRPALPYEEGAPLSVGRSMVSIAGGEPVEMIVMLPRGSYLAGQ